MTYYTNKEVLLKGLMFDDEESFDFPPYNKALVRMQLRALMSKEGLVNKFERQIRRKFDKSYEALGEDNCIRFAVIPKELTKSGVEEVICLSGRKTWNEMRTIPIGIRRIPIPPNVFKNPEYMYYIDKALLDAFYTRLEFLMRKDGKWDKASKTFKNWIIDSRHITKL